MSSGHAGFGFGPSLDAAATYLGLTEAQLRDLITYLRTCVGPDQSGRAAAILDQVLAAGRRVP